MGCCATIDTGEVGFLDICGKFERVVEPGFICLIPLYENLSGKLSMRVQQHDIYCQTKTLDNVFVSVQVSVQFRVKRGHEQQAYYELTNPTRQIESYVFDSLRAEVPKFTLDDIFIVKDKMSSAVKSSVMDVMSNFGYEILATPITDIDPDAGVKQAMNETQRQKRLKKAAEDQGEAQKTLSIKQSEAAAAKIRIEAEAEADASELQGQGLSRQRQAIVEGLQKSVQLFTDGVKGMDPQTVMDMILITQYFDTMKDIGASSKNTTVFVPHQPGAIADVTSQLRQGFLEASASEK